MKALEQVLIPYGETAQILETQGLPLLAVLTPRTKDLNYGVAQEVLVREALAAPINSLGLEQLAKGKKNAVVIISDHTRPVPSKLLLPPMLAALRQGNPDIDITLLVATGCHRGITPGELEAKLGPKMAVQEKIVIHDCDDETNMVFLGILPSGARLSINRLAAEADLLLAEGFIEPHFFAGFSGGRKSVLPGICQRTTVLGNHCSSFISHPAARAGVLQDNPIHQDMLAGAAMAGLDFILNVIIDENKRIAAAFAGDPDQAHEAGCRLLADHCLVKAVPADIVITSNGGYPLDQNIYQCVKSLTAAEATAAPGAVLILCAACSDGHGSQPFYDALTHCRSLPELMEQVLATSRENTLPDQWQYQILLRILLKHEVIFVTEAKNRPLVEAMHMTYASALQEALSLARAKKGSQAGVTIIPDGVSIIVDQ